MALHNLNRDSGKKTMLRPSPPSEHDNEAWQRVFRALVTSLIREFDHAIAEDAAQQALVVASLRHRECRLDHVADFNAWLRRTARNFAIRIAEAAQAQRSREQTLTFDPRNATFVEPAADDDRPDQEAFNRAFAKLPVNLRALWWLRWKVGVSAKRLSKLFGLHEGNINRHLTRAREMLRAELLREKRAVGRAEKGGCDSKRREKRNGCM